MHGAPVNLGDHCKSAIITNDLTYNYIISIIQVVMAQRVRIFCKVSVPCTHCILAYKFYAAAIIVIFIPSSSSVMSTRAFVYLHTYILGSSIHMANLSMPALACNNVYSILFLGYGYLHYVQDSNQLCTVP